MLEKKEGDELYILVRTWHPNDDTRALIMEKSSLFLYMS